MLNIIMKETILITIIVIIIYLFLFHNKKNVVLIEGRDKNKYLVYNDKQKVISAVLLGDVVQNMFKLRDYLYNNVDKYPEYTNYIKQLYTNLNKDRSLIYENDPNSKLTSFSINKGEEIGFCLKSKKTGDIHDINLIMYVAIHEMAHIACPEIGHGDLFKKIFKLLTEVAIEINIYKLENYETQPIEYCGMILSSNILI
jgi:predicted metal-dependent hydrolase